jgi:hypothetical protein
VHDETGYEARSLYSSRRIIKFASSTRMQLNFATLLGEWRSTESWRHVRCIILLVVEIPNFASLKLDDVDSDVLGHGPKKQFGGRATSSDSVDKT